LLGQLNLHRLAGFLLNDGRAVSGGSVDDELANAKLYEVAAAQLAVDSNVEQRQVSKAVLPLLVEADRPDLLRLQRWFGSNERALVPGNHRPCGWRRTLRARTVHDDLFGRGFAAAEIWAW